MADNFEPIPEMYRESLLLFAADMLQISMPPKEIVEPRPEVVMVSADSIPGLPSQPYSELLVNNFFDAPTQDETTDSLGAERRIFSPKRIVKSIATRIKRIRHGEEQAVDPLLQTALWEHEPAPAYVTNVDPKTVFSIETAQREATQNTSERTRRARAVLVKAAAVVLAVTLAAGPVVGALADKSSVKQIAKTEQPSNRHAETKLNKALHGLSFILPRNSLHVDSGEPIHTQAERLRNRYGVIPDRRVVQ